MRSPGHFALGLMTRAQNGGAVLFQALHGARVPLVERQMAVVDLEGQECKRRTYQPPAGAAGVPAVRIPASFVGRIPANLQRNEPVTHLRVPEFEPIRSPVEV